MPSSRTSSRASSNGLAPVEFDETSSQPDNVTYVTYVDHVDPFERSNLPYLLSKAYREATNQLNGRRRMLNRYRPGGNRTRSQSTTWMDRREKSMRDRSERECMWKAANRLNVGIRDDTIHLTSREDGGYNLSFVPEYGITSRWRSKSATSRLPGVELPTDLTIKLDGRTLTGNEESEVWTAFNQSIKSQDPDKLTDLLKSQLLDGFTGIHSAKMDGRSKLRNLISRPTRLRKKDLDRYPHRRPIKPITLTGKDERNPFEEAINSHLTSIDNNYLTSLDPDKKIIFSGTQSLPHQRRTDYSGTERSINFEYIPGQYRLIPLNNTIESHGDRSFGRESGVPSTLEMQVQIVPTNEDCVWGESNLPPRDDPQFGESVTNRSEWMLDSINSKSIHTKELRDMSDQKRWNHLSKKSETSFDSTNYDLPEGSRIGIDNNSLHFDKEGKATVMLQVYTDTAAGQNSTFVC